MNGVILIKLIDEAGDIEKIKVSQQRLWKYTIAPGPLNRFDQGLLKYFL